MDIQTEETVTHYITMDRHDFRAARKMMQVWYDGLANGDRPTVIEFAILDAFGVEH